MWVQGGVEIEDDSGDENSKDTEGQEWQGCCGDDLLVYIARRQGLGWGWEAEDKKSAVESILINMTSLLQIATKSIGEQT